MPLIMSSSRATLTPTTYTLIKANLLALGTISQQAKLTTFKQALMLAKDLSVHIYPYSKYAYKISHLNILMWGGKSLPHPKETPITISLVQDLLDPFSVHCSHDP